MNHQLNDDQLLQAAIKIYQDLRGSAPTPADAAIILIISMAVLTKTNGTIAEGFFEAFQKDFQLAYDHLQVEEGTIQ